MATIQAAATGKLVLVALVLSLTLSVMGCATGPLGSHGVDSIPAFANPNEGMGR
jgi:hypothetical protein